MDLNDANIGLIHELGYDPSDVCDVRVTDDGVVEIDFIDFDDDDWPIITHHHRVPPPATLN